MSVTDGPARSALLFALCVALAACKDEPPPQKVDPDQPLVQRPRRPEPDEDSPFRNPATEAPEGREGEQLPEAELEKTLASAMEMIANERRSEASGVLLDCANKIPASARCDGELGLLLADIKRRKAEADYYMAQAARVDDPKADAELYGRLADALRARGLFEDAVTAAEFALAREPTADRHLALSRVLQSMPDQLPRAAQELGEAFALDAENYELLHEQATVLGQISEPEAAESAAKLFEQYLEKAAPSEERAQATKIRIDELRTLAERIAREQKAAEKAAKKKSG